MFYLPDGRRGIDAWWTVYVVRRPPPPGKHGQLLDCDLDHAV